MTQLPVSRSTLAYHYEGKLTGSGTICSVFADNERWILISDATPFHPEDYGEGDQPGDRGILLRDGVEYAIDDARTMIVDLNDVNYQWPAFRNDIRPRRDDPTCLFLVAHVMNSSLGDVGQLVGSAIELKVDVPYRMKLSRGHTAVHVMSLCLNEVFQRFWRKSPGFDDSLGRPHFDSLAVQKSKVGPLQGVDIYRLGKGIRKKGFDVDAFYKVDPKALAEEMTSLARGLVGRNEAVPIMMTGDSVALGSSRFWNAALDIGAVRIPCGGTHCTMIGQIGEIEFELHPDAAEGSLTVNTLVR